MKIIRPEYKEEKFGKNAHLIIDGHEVTPFRAESIEVDFVENLMQQTIDENRIKIEITFTKKQHETWLQKGGERWLKNILTKN